MCSVSPNWNCVATLLVLMVSDLFASSKRHSFSSNKIQFKHSQIFRIFKTEILLSKQVFSTHSHYKSSRIRGILKLCWLKDFANNTNTVTRNRFFYYNFMSPVSSVCFGQEKLCFLQQRRKTETIEKQRQSRKRHTLTHPNTHRAPLKNSTEFYLYILLHDLYI